jgi:hypothetical protein
LKQIKVYNFQIFTLANFQILLMWQTSNPAYWWGLLALAVPVVIHLYNRRQTQVKLMGTLRWLEEVQTARWNFRRIHQWPLLLVRLLLLTVVVLLLIELYRKDKSAAREKLHALVLIHPAAGDTTQYRQLAAGWQNDTVKVHWLAPEFPAATEQVTEKSNHIWSLVAEAGLRFRTDSIHIIAPDQQMYFTGTPPRLKAALSWELTEIRGDSIRLLWAGEVNNEPEMLWFRTQASQSGYRLQKGLQNTSPEQTQVIYSADRKAIEVNEGTLAYRVAVTTPDTLIVAAAEDENREDEWLLFQKAVKAVAQYHQVPVKFRQEQHTTADWLLSFTEDLTKQNKSNLLVWYYIPGNSADWLEPAGLHSLIIRKELTAARVLEGGFLEALRPHILAFKYKQALPIQADFRKVDLTADGWNGGKRQIATLAEPVQQKTGDERLWLGLFSLILLTLERLWPKKVG